MYQADQIESVLRYFYRSCWFIPWLFWLVSSCSAQQVSLSASNPNPVVGETIEIILTMQGISSPVPMELKVPWMTGMSAEEWLKLHENQSSNNQPGLLLRCMNQTILAPLVSPGVHELRWTMTVREPAGEDNSHKLAAVQVGKFSSQPLVLDVRRLSVMPAPAGVWDLGVGSFQVAATWSKPTVVLGDEVELRLQVSGRGNLKQLKPPELANQPGWEQGRFLIDALPDILQNDKRVFRYRIRPRQLRLSVPPVTIRSYDPATGALNTTQVKVPGLKIVSGLEQLNTPSIRTSTEAFSYLPEFQQSALIKHREGWHWPSLDWLLCLPGLVMIFVILRVSCERFAPESLKRWRWNWGKWKLKRKLQSLDIKGDPVAYRRLLVEYLGEGLETSLASDHETLQDAVSQTEQTDVLAPLLYILEEAELGPQPCIPEELHQKVLDCLQKQEA